MVKSFEHLSDAQLEQYGTESFPGTSDAHSIEAHLEDCDYCRSRVLEHQRARFALFADAPMETSSTTRLGPTSACTLSSGLSISDEPSSSTSNSGDRSNSGGSSNSGGPSEDDLRALAAGILSPDKAQAMTQHVAKCSHCASIVRTFIEDFSDELTADEIKAENEMLAQLKSSSPRWQKDMARKAMRANRSSTFSSSRRDVPAGAASVSTLQPARTSGWSLRWILVPAAVAACAAIAFGLWFTQRDTPEKVEKLLAQAYTEQRTMEYRWPGAEWGPVRVTRGAGQSHLSQPTSQLEAEKILAEHEASTSSTPKWLTAKAEAELLDNQPQLAITDLTQALSANPGSSDLELMLAIAYAQQGDKLDVRASREKALELLNRILKRKALADPAVLYNRALLYQRLAMPEQAIGDLTELIQHQPQSLWADEARAKLAELKH